MNSKHPNYLRYIMSTLWTNWAIGAGSVALALILPRVLHYFDIPKLWLAAPLLFISYFIAYYERQERSLKGGGGTAVLHICGLTLFWSALIIIIIGILNSKMLFDGLIDWSSTNRDIPYITALIIFPVLMLMCLWVMAHGYVQSMAEGYRAHSGILPGNGAVATLFSIETRFQVRTMLYVSVALNVIEWWYYFAYYFNTNMNTPDIFFFNWMPVVLFIMSLFFMVSRYRGLAAMIGPIAIASHGHGTPIRYILISGDRILLAPDSFGRMDTPAVTALGPIDAHNEIAIRGALEKISGTDTFDLRFLYETTIGTDTDILHYAAFLPDEITFENWNDAQWMTIDDIDRLIKSAGMAAEFTDEIYRIFTITLAWKTYHADGRRIYPIKNYRPSFRIRDMKDWTVDYSDQRWLDIARNNQDKPFFHIRRLWRRLTGYNRAGNHQQP